MKFKQFSFCASFFHKYLCDANRFANQARCDHFEIPAVVLRSIQPCFMRSLWDQSLNDVKSNLFTIKLIYIMGDLWSRVQNVIIGLQSPTYHSQAMLFMFSILHYSKHWKGFKKLFLLISSMYLYTACKHLILFNFLHVSNRPIKAARRLHCMTDMHP